MMQMVACLRLLREKRGRKYQRSVSRKRARQVLLRRPCLTKESSRRRGVDLGMSPIKITRKKRKRQCVTMKATPVTQIVIRMANTGALGGRQGGSSTAVKREIVEAVMRHLTSQQIILSRDRASSCLRCWRRSIRSLKSFYMGRNRLLEQTRRQG